MTSPAQIAQVRLNGVVSLDAYRGLRALVEKGPLARIYVDLRDWDGEHIVHLPARIVALHQKDGDDAPTVEVSIAAVLVAERPVEKKAEATLSEIARARKDRSRRPCGDGARRSRKEIEERDRSIRELREQGFPVRLIAQRYEISEARVHQVLRTDQ